MEKRRRDVEVRGTRSELVEELLRLAEGWDHFGNEAMRLASEQGAIRIEDGADELSIGHTKYVVVCERDTTTAES